MHYPAFQNRSFFREPDWRWARVRTLVDRFPTPGRASRHDDEFVRGARTFTVRLRNAELHDDQAAKAKLWFETPDLYYALEFHRRLNEAHDKVMYMEARLLAGQSFEAIADVMGVTPGTIKWYEALFFNIVDHLKQRDWITSQVLIPAIKRSPLTAGGGPFQNQDVVKPFLDGSLKMFAYFGGPHVVDALLSGFQAGMPAAARDDVNSWFDRQWATTIRRRSGQAAMQFEINKYNVTELFAVHAKIIELDRADDADETSRSSYEKMIGVVLSQLPFAAGEDGGKPYAGMILPELDKLAAELRSSELLQIAAGRPQPKLDEDWPEKLPEGRKSPPSITHEDALN